MGLAFVQLGFFVYGYLTVVWTHDVAWAIAGPATLWFGLVWSAIQPGEQQVHFHVHTLLTLLLGVWTGATFVWRFGNPRLIDLRIFHIDDTSRRPLIFTPMAVGYIVQALLITLGVYYLRGDFSDGAGTVSEAAALGAGLTLVIFFGVTLVTTIAGKLVVPSENKADPFLATHRTRADRLNIKNLLVYAALLATPAIYDVLFLSGFDTWHGAVLLATLVVVYFLFFWYKGYVAWWVDDGQSLFYSAYLGGSQRIYEEFISKEEVLWFILLSGGVHFVSMLVGWLVDIFTDAGDPTPLVLAFGALAVFWTVVFVVLSAFDIKFDQPEWDKFHKPGYHKFIA